MIKCTTIYDKEKYIPKEELILRVSGYGVIIKEGKILLITIKESGKYFFPGGGIKKGELLEDAIKREIKEETGYKVKIKKFLDFKENFFHYDPSGKTYHSFLFFYLCEIKSGSLHKSNEMVIDGSAENPAWVKIKDLKIKGFPLIVGEILAKHVLKSKN